MFDPTYPSGEWGGMDPRYSDTELEAMYDAHMDSEEHRETHCGWCGGELRATESGLVVCARCSAIVKTFAVPDWPSMGDAA